jgi:nanoRNase/pAp phosphatase (c-di-AMP/oligoRNAs hydrolase)
VPSFDLLGEFYTKHTELFFDVPLVNIDFRASNENYGQFNLVTLSATSTSEIILDLINKFEASLIDENIATQLLAGIITETNSFQHVRTTPQTFLKASQLVGLGAKQQDIINNLYKSKSLGLLKLWGRVLARLKQETELSLVYSAVNQNDIVKSQAVESDVDAIIKEMTSQLGFAKIFLFLKEENPTTSKIYLHSIIPLNLLAIFSAFNPQAMGAQTVKFTINSAVIDAEKQVVELLKNQIDRLKPAM